MSTTAHAPASAPAPSAAQWPAAVPALFVGTAFLAAFLLFLVQPLVAKMLLPRFGGVPAVWNTCQVFFQFVLLVGYGYAHLAITRFGVRRQALVHLPVLLLPALSLPLALPAAGANEADAPLGALLALLAVSVGLPFFVVSTTAPLLQRWYAASGRPGAADPYFLYAASNLGSLIALVGYPLAVEPLLTLREQALAWTGGFAVLAVLLALCGRVVRVAPASADDRSGTAADEAGPPIPGRTKARWVLLAFVPSSLMLGVTTHVTTDIAPIPFLWVVPLALYLLSFVLVFGRMPQWLRTAAGWALPGSVLLALADLGMWPSLAFHLVFFFAAALVLHDELARHRPAPGRLTEYFLWMSVGGVLGGVANAILAPLVLNGYYEYRATIVLACLLAPSPWPAADRRPPGRIDLILPTVLGALAALVYFQSHSTDHRWAAAAACAALVRRPVRFGLGVLALLVAAGAYDASTEVVLDQTRNFFGTLRVTQEADADRVHRLSHGTTAHGVQQLHQEWLVRRVPRAYFYPTGPIGQVFVANLRRGWSPPVAVVGLGAGSLASYARGSENGRPAQELAFFELDPAVVRVAQNPGYFTYLSESPGRVRIVLGDARLTLAREPAGHFGLIVIDAFTSDAIPVHLLTREALDVYLDTLTADGVIAFHISNRYLDLTPVLDGLARTRGLFGVSQRDLKISEAESRRAKFGSHWVLLGRTERAVRAMADDRWEPLPNSPKSPVWTDDYSNVLGVLKFRP